MNAEIHAKQTFEPFEIVLTVNDLDEAQKMWTFFNCEICRCFGVNDTTATKIRDQLIQIHSSIGDNKTHATNRKAIAERISTLR